MSIWLISLVEEESLYMYTVNNAAHVLTYSCEIYTAEINSSILNEDFQLLEENMTNR